MMKRQRHYSGWEIAGLMGSTLCLLYLISAPLSFIFALSLGLMLDDYFSLISMLLGMILVAATLSLGFRQWFKPRPIFSIIIGVAYIGVAIAGITSAKMNEKLFGADLPEEMVLTHFDITSLTIQALIMASLIIWMNRPRWRKVTASQIEAFE